MGFDGRDTTPRFNQSPFIAFRALFDVLGTTYPTPLRFPGMDTVTEPVVDCGGKATLLHVGLPTLFLYLYALSPGPYRYTFPALRKSVVLQGELGAVHSPETAR